MNYSKEFKEEALKLSDEIGLKKAAAQLGIKYYTLADWRSKRKEQLNAPRLTHAEQQHRIRELERENLIKQDFHADHLLKKLLTDVTEVSCLDGKLYVSPIMDCFNGEIVALEMRENMKKELCVDTLQQLKTSYGKRLSGAILHSDRGSQYTSGAFRKKLRNMGMIQSLSGVHHCYDNARMESFFATLKKEKLYRIPTHRMTRDEVRTVIFPVCVWLLQHDSCHKL